MDDRQEILQQLTGQLTRARGVRAATGLDPALAAGRQALRRWQAERLARTHADLLESPRFARAAHFFLSDLYGPADLDKLHAETERVVPAMSRLLPTAGLVAIAHALELDAVSEELDAAMAAVLGTGALSAASYGAAYRTVGLRSDRERQIALIEELGGALDRLGRMPLIGTTLVAMRLPARLARLGDLQDFLERGYSAFHGTPDVAGFVALVVARERAVMAALFAGDDGVLERRAEAQPAVA